MSEIQIEIAGYSKKGHGITDLPEPIEVHGSVKGDVILAKLLKRVKKRRQTEVLEIIKPSSSRVSPKCKHASVCGGCKWQQIDYPAQLAEKKAFIEALYKEHKVDDIVPSEKLWHYRGKMEFTFSQNKAGDRFLGLMRLKGRFHVEDIQECSIAPSWMSDTLTQVRKWWEISGLKAFHAGSGTGDLRNLTMRYGQNTDAKMVFLTINGGSDTPISKKTLQKFAEAAQFDEKTSVFLVVQHAQKGKETTFSEMHLAGPTNLEETLLGQKFHLSPRAFFQPNTQVAEKMFSYLIEIVKKRECKKVLDLYCGIGTIGILLSKHVQQVIGVELNAHAVCDAKEVIEEQGLENIQVFCEDAGAFINDIEGLFAPDTIVIDPPRSGLSKEAIRDIEKVAPKTLIYVSCNPKTQAEDLEKLVNYKIDSIRPFDQFPHTVHVECIVVLSRLA